MAKELPEVSMNARGAIGDAGSSFGTENRLTKACRGGWAGCAPVMGKPMMNQLAHDVMTR